MKTIEFINYGDPIHPLFNPVPAKKLLPEWYKKLERYIGNKEEITSAKYLMDNNQTQGLPETVKACVPVQDYICGGYIIQATADLLFTQTEIVNEKTSWCWWSANENLMTCDVHYFKQFPLEIQGKNHNYFKIVHKLGIKTPEGYSCLFYQPEFFFENRFKLLPAIVDTDTYHTPVNFPGFFSTNDVEIKIDVGTPLMVVMPFKRDEWEHKITNTSDPQEKQFTAEQWYRRFYHSQKSFD